MNLKDKLCAQINELAKTDFFKKPKDTIFLLDVISLCCVGKEIFGDGAACIRVTSVTVDKEVDCKLLELDHVHYTDESILGFVAGVFSSHIMHANENAEQLVFSTEQTDHDTSLVFSMKWMSRTVKKK